MDLSVVEDLESAGLRASTVPSQRIERTADFDDGVADGRAENNASSNKCQVLPEPVPSSAQEGVLVSADVDARLQQPSPSAPIPSEGAAVQAELSDDLAGLTMW